MKESDKTLEEEREEGDAIKRDKRKMEEIIPKEV